MNVCVRNETGVFREKIGEYQHLLEVLELFDEQADDPIEAISGAEVTERLVAEVILRSCGKS